MKAELDSILPVLGAEELGDALIYTAIDEVRGVVGKT